MPTNYFGSEEKTYLEEGELREISSSFELKFEDDDLPAFYVFSYADGDGYVIISADLRHQAIMAFSNTGSFNKNDTVPDAMYEWIGFNLEVISDIRQGTYLGTTDAVELTEILQHQYNDWVNLFDNMNLGDPPTGFERPTKWEDPTNPMDCNTPYFARKNQLLQTSWGQGVGYNDLISHPTTCTQYTNGKPPVGCVATATAQILKYWSKPYIATNYVAMPNNSGNINTQFLMSHLGNWSNLDMDYDCEGSGAYSHRVVYTLDNTFDYSNPGTYSAYTRTNRWDIKSDLDANRVVYVDAATTLIQRNILGIYRYNTYRGGHAWLVDGYEAIGNNCSVHFWYHMNWGWDGRFNDWFFEADWNAGPGNNYQYDKHYIRNIQP